MRPIITFGIEAGYDKGVSASNTPRDTPTTVLGVALSTRVITAIPDAWIDPLWVVRDGDDAALTERIATQVAGRAAPRVVIVAAGVDGRSPVPLADRLRNQLGVAIVVELAAPTAAEIDALIAAGRCDAVLVRG